MTGRRARRTSPARHPAVWLTSVLAMVTGLGTGLVAAAPAGAAGRATKLVLSTPTSLSLGTGLAIRVTAEDASGSVVTNYTGTVALTSSDPGFVPVTPSTLFNGTGTFYSTLSTAGNQTITATDTVSASITGTSTPVAVARPPAVTVKVTGSALAGVTASPESVDPAFSPAVTDYVLACPKAGANAVTLTLSAPAGQTITANGQSGATLSESETLRANQAVVLFAPSPSDGSRTRAYWFRCLPPDFPVLRSTVARTPPPGWILTGSGGAGVDHYAMVLDKTGTPVWWRSTGGYDAADLQSLQNETLAWGWGFTSHNSFFDLLNGTTASLGTNAHDLYQLPDGDVLGLYWLPKTGVDLTGIGDGTNQTIGDCQIREYSPGLQLVWSWDASRHISPDESQLATPSVVNGWDVFHCNSIDVDPNSADPNNPNLLLSMRNTSAAYYVVNPTAATDAGQVLWKFGGGAPIAGSPDAAARHYVVSGDPEGPFVGQHDVRFEAHGDVSVFDDGSPALGSSACTHAARGVDYHLDPSTLTATNVWQYVVPSGLCAYFLGSFRRYAGGTDNLLAWGDGTGTTFMSEVDATGAPVLTISGSSGDSDYRAIKAPESALDVNQLRQDMGGIIPAVTAISPSSGPLRGSTVVTLTGHGFTQADAVHFGSVPATSFTVVSDTTMTAIAPPSTQGGKVLITVANAAGASGPTRADQYSYVH